MKTIGIIGGLGPLATIDLFKKIVDYTDAAKDQDHLPILVNNQPQIPDRTQALLHGGPSPVADIVQAGKVLEDMGADFLVIPCNTSFGFYEEIQSQLRLPLLSMIDLTLDEIQKKSYSKVCILGTEGTIKTGVYHHKLLGAGIEVPAIQEDFQDALTHVIYDIVKKNDFPEDIRFFTDPLDKLGASGVQAFVLGCTELPIFFERYQLNYKTIDPTELLAREAVRLAKEE